MLCKYCQKNFSISPVGSKILEGLKIPAPKVCDECSMRLLMSFRNERTFYPRQCDLCKKDIIAMYPKETPYTVYCPACWWSDKWEGAVFAKEYKNPEQFFSQLKELQQKVPRESLVNLNSPNCDYSNHIRHSTGCYMCSLVSDQSENNYYCYWIVTTKDSADCYYGRNSEKCYFGVVILNCYNCSYLLEAENCLDCHYCYDIRGCKNCLFCHNLRNQNYMFENRQLTKEEYEEKFKEFKSVDNKKRQEYWKKWLNLIKNAIHKYSYQTNCEKCTGDNLQNCTEVELGYNSFNSEQAHNAGSSIFARNIVNGFAVGSQPVEYAFNAAVIKGGNNVINCYNTTFSSDIYFSENLVSCNECIGCIGLHKKKYCILNKQYEKGEYLKIKKELLNYWQRTEIISEFFPKNFSTFAYNETAAMDFYPLTKEQAIANGYSFKDDLPQIKGLEIKQKDVLVCINCKRNYKIIEQEKKLYKTLNIPVHLACPNCRHKKRLALMGDRVLTKMQCENKDCQNKFITKYKEKDNLKVYCEKCYNKEIY